MYQGIKKAKIRCLIKIHMIPCLKNHYVHLFDVSVLLIRLDLVYSGCLKPI